jgi:2-phospho-L-lactate guanylyltransferase
VAAAAKQLAAEGFDMLALPGDIPLVAPADIARLLAAQRPPPAFTIVPARDQMGSNAVLCSPAGAVPLRFGEESFLPHLDAARARGIEPLVIRLPRIALDIDTPEDLALFRATPSRTRARELLDRWDTDLVAEFGKAT